MIPAHLQNRSIEELRSTQETIRCFMVKPVGEGYESVIVTEEGSCVGNFHYHRTEKVIKRFSLDPNGDYPEEWTNRDEKANLVPTYCARCGNHDFSPEALKKFVSSKGRIWERVDTGERADNINAFGPGAMWFADWYCAEDLNLSGPPLMVRTPGGDWMVDSRCTNCTLPDDKDHRCWPRVGEAPNITVDKTVGRTCDAGGGSVVHGDYHGFLRNGYLVRC
jgi:ribosomal protein S18